MRPDAIIASAASAFADRCSVWTQSLLSSPPQKSKYLPHPNGSRTRVKFTAVPQKVICAMRGTRFTFDVVEGCAKRIPEESSILAVKVETSKTKVSKKKRAKAKTVGRKLKAVLKQEAIQDTQQTAAVTSSSRPTAIPSKKKVTLSPIMTRSRQGSGSSHSASPIVEDLSTGTSDSMMDSESIKGTNFKNTKAYKVGASTIASSVKNFGSMPVKPPKVIQTQQASIPSDIKVNSISTQKAKAKSFKSQQMGATITSGAKIADSIPVKASKPIRPQQGSVKPASKSTCNKVKNCKPHPRELSTTPDVETVSFALEKASRSVQPNKTSYSSKASKIPVKSGQQLQEKKEKSVTRYSVLPRSTSEETVMLDDIIFDYPSPSTSPTDSADDISDDNKSSKRKRSLESDEDVQRDRASIPSKRPRQDEPNFAITLASNSSFIMLTNSHILPPQHSATTAAIEQPTGVSSRKRKRAAPASSIISTRAPKRQKSEAEILC
ncbi:hypothetical protein BKA69DRAFT_1123487 [Paraphysoderma sedebokerense]|nr:hypothetical protein BKA69DRAFT_1123487 [Paraphysoderma sedebokerense]